MKCEWVWILHAAMMGFWRLLLRDFDFDGAKSSIGTLCQPVTSGMDGGACRSSRGVGHDPRRS